MPASVLVDAALALASLIAPAQATLLFAGDAMMHQGQIDAARQSSGSYAFDTCFLEIAPIVRQADFAVVNLETPLGGKPYSGYPCFCAPDSYAEALSKAGFDLMLTANNHTLDRRDRGLKRTIATLDSLRIPHIGTYRDRADRDSLVPKIVDINGFRVGFLNYTYGTNGIAIQGDAVVDYIDRNQIASDIRAARKGGAELIVAAVHWGMEYQLLPHPSQRRLADELVDQGVDMVIGGHPHVIQPMEMRQRTDGRNALVVYSLGNFISNMKTRDTRGGALAQVTIARDSLGRAVVNEASYRLVFTIPGRPGGPNFTLHPAERVTSGAWAGACRDFSRSADAIFAKHNVKIGRDTTHVIEKIKKIAPPAKKHLHR